MSVVYLAALLLSLTGLGLLDYRHHLAVGNGAAVKTLVIVGASMAFFLVWDVFGIASGVFFRGGGPWMTGILLAPELPLEEVFFLAVLSYSTLLSYLWAAKFLAKRRSS